MSKVRLIRCKTPADIIVINERDRNRFASIAEDLANSRTSCGHPHMIVQGDVYFSRGRRRA